MAFYIDVTNLYGVVFTKVKKKKRKFYVAKESLQNSFSLKITPQTITVAELSWSHTYFVKNRYRFMNGGRSFEGTI